MNRYTLAAFAGLLISGFALYQFAQPSDEDTEAQGSLASEEDTSIETDADLTILQQDPLEEVLDPEFELLNENIQIDLGEDGE